MPTPEEQAAIDAAAQADAETAAAAAAANDKGFPAETPLAEMTEAQQAAYHRFHSRKHEGVANTYKALGTPEQIKAWKEAAEAAEQAKLTPSDQAVAAAREEGRKAAIAEANDKAARSILRSGLLARDIPAEDIDDILDTVNTSAFVVGDEVNADKAHTWVNRFGHLDQTNGTTRSSLDMGQGRRERVQQAAGAAGKAEAARRFGTQQS